MKHCRDRRVIVVGGGHAGCEAAAAAARMGAETILVTHREDTIGEMSCNPAIGGVGKGHLVREIDALDGLMARAIDVAGIQFRMLNGSKGPAVRGPRAQADRKLYRAAMQQLISAQEGLEVVEGGVEDIIVTNGRCQGVVLLSGMVIPADAVVVTTGTFLRGMIHRGEERIPAGRLGEAAAIGLAERLEALALPMGRLKTGTPPRLLSSSIDWHALEQQPADADPVPFSFSSLRIDVPQICCGITHTNSETHEIIRANLHRTASYSGALSGRGPRYCPSIEDKVVRFADKPSHQIFLEPEGLDDDKVYPNGISNALPAEVQSHFVHSIAGLNEAVIVEPGYAIEYDYVDPRALSRDLELRALPGLFLAGQINGTTGYEEAAAQGLIAGVNAARSPDVDPFSIDRSEGYIGVLVDDLITLGVSEPYRMFTSRAEYRLSLRADNADDRLTQRGIDVGVVGDARAEMFHVKHAHWQKLRSWSLETQLTPQEAEGIGVRVKQDGRRRSVLDLLALPDVEFSYLAKYFEPLDMASRDERAKLEAEATYAGFIDRQTADIQAYRQESGLKIPNDFPFEAINGLSSELVERLKMARPSDLGQAARVEGITPAALSLLLVHLKKVPRVA